MDKEEIPVSRQSMHGYTLDLLQAFEGEHLSAVGSQQRGC